jgi:transcriptional regulator with XRE-family HTH domain
MNIVNDICILNGGEKMTSVLAHTIKDRLYEKGLSVYGLEKLAGLKHSSVQNIIRGRSKNPSIDIITSIARVLNCTVEDLLSNHPFDPQLSRTNTLDATHKHLPNQTELTSFFENNWDISLYIEASENIFKLLKNSKIEVDYNNFIFLVTEVYKYSWSHKKIDKKFTAWLIQNKLGPNNE